MIRYAVEDEIAPVTIDRPEKRNALSYALLGYFLFVDHKEGVAAFLEKRPAKFTGR